VGTLHNTSRTPPTHPATPTRMRPGRNVVAPKYTKAGKPIKRYCPHGHDKWKYSYWCQDHWKCLICSRAHQRKYNRFKRREPYTYTVRFCPHGHDKAAVGVKKNGDCAECSRLRDRRYRERLRAERAKTPQPWDVFEMPHLKAVRIQLGLTRPELARLSGVNYYTIAKIEARKRRPSRVTYHKLMRVIAPRLRVMRDELGEWEIAG
jgi:DNA-binding XRE family transcriptional regulator